MAKTFEDMLKKFYTEKGLRALETRLKISIEYYNDPKTKYPFIKKLLSFLDWEVASKRELLGRIIETAHLIGATLSFDRRVDRDRSGETMSEIFKIEIVKLRKAEW